MRLINADALPRHGKRKGLIYSADVDKAPTVDAVFVVHGRWIDIDEQPYTLKIRCSCCGNERSMVSTQGTYPNYCENCGADMRGEQDG